MLNSRSLYTSAGDDELVNGALLATLVGAR